MQRHLSTGSRMLAALMQSDRSAASQKRQADPLHDVMKLLAQQDHQQDQEISATTATRPN